MWVCYLQMADFYMLIKGLVHIWHEYVSCVIRPQVYSSNYRCEWTQNALRTH